MRSRQGTGLIRIDIRLAERVKQKNWSLLLQCNYIYNNKYNSQYEAVVVSEWPYLQYCVSMFHLQMYDVFTRDITVTCNNLAFLQQVYTADDFSSHLQMSNNHKDLRAKVVVLSLHSFSQYVLLCNACILLTYVLQ